MTAKRRMPLRSRAIAAGVLATVLALTASGCSGFALTAPSSVTDVLDAAVQALEATDGVASASSNVGPDEPLAGGVDGDADSWVAQLSVTVDADVKDLGSLLDAASEQTKSVRSVTRVNTTVSAQLGPASVPTLFVLSAFDGTPRPSTGADLADAGVALASIPGATSVSVPATTVAAEVSVAEPAAVPQAAAAVRTLATMGTGPLTAVTVWAAAEKPQLTRPLSVTLDAVAPSNGLVETLAAMLQRPGIDSVEYSAAGRNDSGTGTAGRPGVLVKVDSAGEANEVATQLAGIDAGASVVANSARAAFSVYESSSSTSSATGFLGLPLGSPAPEDVGPDGSYRSPGGDAARLDADSAAITDLLTAAGTIAGIGGNPSVQVVECSSGAGKQASGSALIPIFDVADTADDAYAAIVDSWTAAGLVYSEGAAGPAIYAATSPALLVRHATIRGTADGISIHAEGGC